MNSGHAEPLDLSASLARELIAAQFPQWGHLPLKPVDPGGWDNRTFRLGDEMSVRLPSAEGYAAQVEREQTWLPILAPQLPLPIPIPLAQGVPTARYPWAWSVYRWLPGQSARLEDLTDPCEFGLELAQFLCALRAIEPAGPPPGPHNFFRGGPLTTYDLETRRALLALGDEVEGDALLEVWEAGLAEAWAGPPVWLHGDLSAGNLLVASGRLSAVIDFGCCGVGDPACDLTIAWTFLAGEARRAFRGALALDPATWARGRGWALWKALITWAEHLDREPARAAKARHVIAEVLADHERATSR
ncbi:MAG: aminoglycoside phosphotransferase family protein [Planctomycetes bacterium]|nr:aminoglycoside phosphotransferase family protein [Planctomycetota bacterium]